MTFLLKSIATGLIAGLPVLFSPVFAATGFKSVLPVVSPVASTGIQSFSIEIKQSPNGESIHLAIANPEGKRLTVRLLNTERTPIEYFITQKGDTQINRQYNFFGADAGVYTFEVYYGKEKIAKKIKLQRVSTGTVTRFIME